MSYTEYLRRKAAAEPVILNTKKPTDASMFTLKKRMEASHVFRVDGTQYGTLITDKDSAGNEHRPVSFLKSTGRPKNASDYTSYLGSQAIHTDSAYFRGRITQTLCGDCIPVLGDAPKNASTVTSEKVNCPFEKGMPVSSQVFVDDTIRLSAMVPSRVTETTCCPDSAIHTTKDTHSLNQIPVRPPAPGIVTQSVAVPLDMPYKQGKALTNIPYVEKHHGNDIFAVPRHIPGFLIIPRSDEGGF